MKWACYLCLSLVEVAKQVALMSTSSSNSCKRLRIDWMWGISWPHLHLLSQRRMELHGQGGFAALLCVCCDYTLQLSQELCLQYLVQTLTLK